MKRVLDIVGALTGVVLLSPVLAAVWFVIVMESGLPGFFRQRRMGRGGSEFTLYKFRSMTVQRGTERGSFDAGGSARVTRVGKLLRKTKLDELPQLWNVLAGDMSLVGPRPERPEFVEEFRDSVRYYNLRHSCKPGLTGWAAVHGLRGNTSLEDRLDYDLYYIENWSLLLDFRIMLMTLAPPKNAY